MRSKVLGGCACTLLLCLSLKAQHAEHGRPSAPELSKEQQVHLTLIRATAEQEEVFHHLGACIDRVREQVQGFEKGARRATFDVEQARAELIQLRDGVNGLQQLNQRFFASLSPRQAQAIAGEIQALQPFQQGIRSSFGALELELDQGRPDPKRLREHADRLKKSIKGWRKQYSTVASALGANL